MELVVEPWIQRLLEALLKKFDRPVTSLEKIFGGLSLSSAKNNSGSGSNRKEIAAESEIKVCFCLLFEYIVNFLYIFIEAGSSEIVFYFSFISPFNFFHGWRGGKLGGSG